jgi:hypothetical protein
MKSDFNALVSLAGDNLARERSRNALQTTFDDWKERLDLEWQLITTAGEVEIMVEPTDWEDVVSFGENAVLGFLVRTTRDSRRDDDAEDLGLEKA